MRQPPWMGAPHLLDDLAAAPYPYRQQSPFGPTGMQRPYYQQAPFHGQQVPYRRIMPTVPGAPALGFRDLPVGLGASAFTASSGTSLTLSGSPGRPFKGRRLLVDITRTGTSATGLITITAFNIGDVNQLVGRGALLANGFTATAFGVDMQMSACAPALTISMVFAISAAPTMTDRVDFGAQIHGETIGS